MMWPKTWLLLAALALPFATAHADDTMPDAPYAYRQLDDAAKEARAKALMETIRCLVCQSQSIADSDARIAGDMRSQIRERIAAGESAESIRDWLVQRYGDYVTYEPRVTAVTWPLYAAPLVLVLVGAGVLWRRMRPGPRTNTSGEA